MGNMCGCVRGPKEECYVDPNKAPLTPGSKELRGGRRYFQRKKKRKSGDFQPGDSLRSRGGESVHSEAQLDPPLDQTPENDKRAAGLPETEAKAARPKLGTLSEGVYVGEVPVRFTSRGGASAGCRKKLALAHGYRRPSDADEDEDSKAVAAAAERNLHGVTRASRRVAPKDNLLERRLLQRQLRRAVSFGAVEHMLRTLRAGGRDAEDRMLEDVKGLRRLIWSTQVHRKRRRAQTCVVASGSQDSLDGVQKPVECMTDKSSEVM